MEQPRSLLGIHRDADRLGRECNLARLRSGPGRSNGLAIGDFLAGPSHQRLAAPLCDSGPVPHGFRSASSGGILRCPGDGRSEVGATAMALDVTPIYRNLRTRVTFFGLEAEDLFAILAVAVVMNICGRFLNREMFGLPMNMVLQYLVPILSVPALMLFKYGKQRGYLLDWVLFHTKPHVYSALERDRELTREYIRDWGARDAVNDGTVPEIIGSAATV